MFATIRRKQVRYEQGRSGMHKQRGGGRGALNRCVWGTPPKGKAMQRFLRTCVKSHFIRD
jgi:hypothetical protein